MEVWRFIFYKLCGKIQNKYFKKESRKKRKKQMMMMLKKMRMMMRRKEEDDEETLIWPPSSPDLRTCPRRCRGGALSDKLLIRLPARRGRSPPPLPELQTTSLPMTSSATTAPPTTLPGTKMTTMWPSAWWGPSGPTVGTVAGTTTHLCLCKKKKNKKI